MEFRSRHKCFVMTGLALALIASCTTTPIVDTSMGAYAAGDFSLPGSACVGVPGGGVDSCLMTEGAEISTAWNLIVPKPKTAIGTVGGTVDVYYKDIHKTYGIDDWVVSVSWKEFFGATTWQASYDGEVMALLTLNWVDAAGIHQIMLARGLAVLVVTKPGYSRMPVNSGNAAWGTDCHIEMSTAGRSVVSCH